jgi:hypothetical protein
MTQRFLVCLRDFFSLTGGNFKDGDILGLSSLLRDIFSLTGGNFKTRRFLVRLLRDICSLTGVTFKTRRF